MPLTNFLSDLENGLFCIVQNYKNLHMSFKPVPILYPCFCIPLHVIQEKDYSPPGPSSKPTSVCCYINSK